MLLLLTKQGYSNWYDMSLITFKLKKVMYALPLIFYLSSMILFCCEHILHSSWYFSKKRMITLINFISYRCLYKGVQLYYIDIKPSVCIFLPEEVAIDMLLHSNILSVV